MPIEKPRLKLGFVPLADSAPLIVARERGFFAEQGLEVELSAEPSWANIRDKVAVGLLDGAQMLATMPLSATLGLGNVQAPIVTALGLTSGGNAITVSNALWARMLAADPQAMAERPLSARALKAVIDADRAEGRPPMSFATVYPVSPHSLELRFWLAAAGIDPDRDLHIVVVPPPRMVASLSAGAIVGYCVGEPWSALAVSLELGRRVITSGELWAGRVEKVLGVRADWAETHPATHQALLRALLLACRWIDAPGNRADVAEIVAPALDAPAAVTRAALERPDSLRFYEGAVTFPWQSQAGWYLAQLRRWGQLPAGLDPAELVGRVYRTDLYRRAAAALGLPFPTIDAKVEGGHRAPWVLEQASAPIAMVADAFLDGGWFDMSKD